MRDLISASEYKGGGSAGVSAHSCLRTSAEPAVHCSCDLDDALRRFAYCTEDIGRPTPNSGLVTDVAAPAGDVTVYSSFSYQTSITLCSVGALILATRRSSAGERTPLFDWRKFPTTFRPP